MLRMRVSKPIVLGAAALLGLGLTTAVAADTHGDAVSAAARNAKALLGEARGDAVSAVANANRKGGPARATINAPHPLNHGAAVSTVATSDATAAHTTGAMRTNHGGAVSAAAQKR
jgi:hypothetical protein